MIKPCAKCGSINKTPSGNCRPCAKIYYKKWYAAHSEYVKAQSTKWKTENPEMAKKNTAKWKLDHQDRIRENSKKYRAANAEKIKAALVKWRSENTERSRELVSRWYKENTDRFKETNAKWHATHPESNRISGHKRRARKLENGGSFSAEQIKNILKQQKNKCVVCRANISKTFHIDHIFPLSRGGSNSATNIQLLCPTCNRCKGARHPIDFMQSRGFLL
jgi:5-methylcytosine-specific restriction endonuclease McrA